MKMIEVNMVNYKVIKKLYDKAVRDGNQSFIYDGTELLTDYAKYLLEYMETIFEWRRYGNSQK